MTADRFGLTDDDYHLIDGKQVVKPGRTARVRMTAADAAVGTLKRG
jgi:hypothetical protein